MDEPCAGTILRSTGEPQKILRVTDQPQRILTVLCLCKNCEKGWSQSLENAHWSHCSTPHRIRVTFYGITKCHDGKTNLPRITE